MKIRGLALLAATAALVAGCTAAPTGGATPEATPSQAVAATPASIAVQGALALSPAHTIGDATSCMGSTGFTDFNHDGLQVVVKDASGATVGIANLGDREPFQGGCVRWFSLDVPAGGKFYSATVGEWTSQTYTEADVGTKNMVVTAG